MPTKYIVKIYDPKTGKEVKELRMTTFDRKYALSHSYFERKEHGMKAKLKKVSW